MTNCYKWIIPTYADKSVKKDKCLRINAAIEQSKMQKVEIKDIIVYVNEFLNLINMEVVENPEVDLISEPIKRGSYTKIWKKNNLNDKRDIVWMKFTKDNFLGVVATGNDINFNINNTSGKIITYLGQEWDKSFVLIFPLKNIPSELNRHRIESGIGNYLISKGVPILDLYSHNL